MALAMPDEYTHSRTTPFYIRIFLGLSLAASAEILAVLFVPLPYLLSHAEHLSGPRLPLDGVLLCYAAFALVSLIPGLVQTPKSAAKSQQDSAKP